MGTTCCSTRTDGGSKSSTPSSDDNACTGIDVNRLVLSCADVSFKLSTTAVTIMLPDTAVMSISSTETLRRLPRFVFMAVGSKDDNAPPIVNVHVSIVCTVPHSLV